MLEFGFEVKKLEDWKTSKLVGYSEAWDRRAWRVQVDDIQIKIERWRNEWNYDVFEAKNKWARSI